MSSLNHSSIKSEQPSHIQNQKTSSDNELDSHQNQEAQDRASLLVPKASSLHQTIVAFREGKHVLFDFITLLIQFTDQKMLKAMNPS